MPKPFDILAPITDDVVFRIDQNFNAVFEKLDNLSTDTSVVNGDSVTLSPGTPVYMEDGDGATLVVKRAKADAVATMEAIGLVVGFINPNNIGKVRSRGILEMSTHGFNAGDILYISASSAGELTSTKPTGTNIPQAVGTVLLAREDGRLFVNLNTATKAQIDLTSDVTGDLPFANMVQIATASLLGRNTASTGDIEALTTIPSAVQDNITRTGTVTSGTWSGSFGAVSGANLTNLTAANIAAGTAGISITGNAGTATVLQTARNINGTSFNGSGDITITAAAGTLTGSTLASGVTASSLTSVGTLSSLDVTGNAIVGGDVDATEYTSDAGSANAPSYAFAIDTNTGIYRAGADSLGFSTGGTSRVVINLGIQVGSPTGGDNGSGTINAAGDIYKNDTAYTNPDYAFEHYYMGSIVRFRDNEGAAGYTGLLPIEELEEYTRRKLHLPRIRESKGIFERADRVLEKLEEAYLYIFQLHARLKALEG